MVKQWAADYSHAVAGGIPILAWDMYEHAYRMDFGAGAGNYADAFMSGVHWDAVYDLYQHAVHGATEPHAAGQDDAAGAVLLDGRRVGMFEQASTMIPGGIWRDPAKVGEWACTLPVDEDIIVYCVMAMKSDVPRRSACDLGASTLAT